MYLDNRKKSWKSHVAFGYGQFSITLQKFLLSEYCYVINKGVKAKFLDKKHLFVVSTLLSPKKAPHTK